MKTPGLLSFLALPVVWAIPTSELNAFLSSLDEYTEVTNAASSNLFGGVANGIGYVLDHAQEVLHDHLHQGQDTLEKWVHEGKQFVKQNGLTYELVTNPAFQDYQLRVTDPDLCDPTVKQHSGYLDVTDGKHLFFWFFESRTSPEKAPLTLWLNGGPGCSSITGLLFENGPCRVTNGGKSTKPFEHSWNNYSNIIFLDQPVDVGYSYSTDGSTVNTSPVAAEDVYAFIELFLARYPEYADMPFHIAAESYGGIYAPNIGSVIHLKNKELTLRPAPGVKHVNLASIILANGQTDPYVQLASVPDYVCDGPYPLFDDPEGAQCTALRSKVPTCQRLIQGCYNYNSRLTCVPAIVYCYSQLMGPVQQTGVNPYDVRKKCDRSKDGSLCYKEMAWVETWMNDAATKKALGVPAERTFQTCNTDVNQAFFSQGDGVKNAAALLPPLVNDGVRLLVYAGNADAMCNYVGNERWMEKLEHNFHAEFAKSRPVPWVTLEGGIIAGEVRSVGGNGFSAGNVTFAQVYEAGHMVPFDQPEAASDLFNRWILDVPLILNATEIASTMTVPFGGLV